MATALDDKQIYIVISQTGTILSKILKIITKKEYNHASITTFRDLSYIYSFGRKHPYNPFWAGFVTESKNFGTFKRFRNTKVIVLSLKVNDEVYNNINERIENMLINKAEYKYNYLGLYLAALKIHFKHKNRYYCSEFVGDILRQNNIEGSQNLEKIVHPMSFLSIPDVETVYTGKLCDYIVS